MLFLATVYGHLAAFHIPFMLLLKDMGYEVHAAACFDGREDEVQSAGIMCWNVSFDRSPYNPKNFKAFLQLRDLLKNCHFDLIHVHTPVAAFLGRYIAKATGQGSVLYTAHGFHFYKGAPLRNWLAYYTAERLASYWTDGLIVMNSEDLESGLRLGFEYEKNLFHVHGVGVDLSHYLTQETSTGESIRSELAIPTEDVVVTCVAEMIPRKNHMFLLDAWKRLSMRCLNCYLLLVGTGKLMAILQEKVRGEKIPRIHFLGFRSDVAQILCESDVVTLTSNHEGLPRCIMEAMAAGKPVVATDVRGSRDLVEHGITGLLVETDDVEGLTNALDKLSTDVQLRSTMGEAALDRINDYSMEVVLAEMKALYDKFLDVETSNDGHKGKS